MENPADTLVKSLKVHFKERVGSNISFSSCLPGAGSVKCLPWEGELQPHPYRGSTQMNSGEERHLQDPAIPNNSWEVSEQTCVSIRNHQKCLWLQRDQQDIHHLGRKHKRGCAGKSKSEASQGICKAATDIPRAWSRFCCFPRKLKSGHSSSPHPKQVFFFKTPFSNTSNPQRVQAVPELPATIQEGFDYREGQRQKKKKPTKPLLVTEPTFTSK